MGKAVGGRRWKKWLVARRGFVLLAVALNDTPYRLLGIAESVVILSLRLNGFPPTPSCGVDLFLEGSL